MDSGTIGEPEMPEPRTCAMCGVVREDVAEVSYYSADREKRVDARCADCKARHLVRRRRSRRHQISRGNRAVEVIGLVLVGIGLVALIVVIVGAIATRL